MGEVLVWNERNRIFLFILLYMIFLHRGSVILIRVIVFMREVKCHGSWVWLKGISR